MRGRSTRRTGRERRRATSLACALAGFGWLGVSCTLTNDDFEPAQVQEPGDGDAEDAGAAGELPADCTVAGCCSTAADCGAAEVCENGTCVVACAAGEDPSICQIPLCPGPGCPDSASCTDGVRNGREPAVDCGEVCARGCAADSACNGNADCASAVCVASRCVEGSCSDGVRNGDETATDCGGSCPAPCPVGAACADSDDCEAAAFCAPSTQLCTDGSCQDGARTGAEVLADCGGGECPGCPTGSPCTAPGDCDSRVCSSGECTPASCTDGLSSGDESGVDCGGSNPDCARCPDGDPCVSGEDCVSGACEAGACVSCSDGSRNGSETDTDCGGGNPECPRCGAEASCSIDDDCTSQDCSGGSCAAESCGDGLRNGTESDTDCGGTDLACGRCAVGDTCVTDADCDSQSCDGGLCISCGDGLRNGTESDTDCGGTDLACGRCAAGDSCQVDADCASNACSGGTCCGGTQVDCTRCAERLSPTVDCGFPSAGVDSTGIVNCNAFLSCLASNPERCPTRNTPGCSGDNQASDACPHNNYGGNAGTGITRASQVLVNAGCQL